MRKDCHSLVKPQFPIAAIPVRTNTLKTMLPVEFGALRVLLSRTIGARNSQASVRLRCVDQECHQSIFNATPQSAAANQQAVDNGGLALVAQNSNSDNSQICDAVGQPDVKHVTIY